MATDEAIIDEMLEPLADALTPDAARVLANLKAPPSIEARVDELAAKRNEGKLTERERADYESDVRIGNLFALIKAKAKRVVAQASHGRCHTSSSIGPRGKRLRVLPPARGR